MKLIFEISSLLDRSTAKIVTHPEEQQHWDSIREAIHQMDTKIVVINAKNNRNVQIKLSSIAVIQSEDRLCSVRLITGEHYLLPKRLKFVEEDLSDQHFVRINNQTIINTACIQTFAATQQARIQVELVDGSSYYVSRYYIKQFRGKLV